MIFDYGFDVYPPLEPTEINQAQYDKFLDAFLAVYGIRRDNGASTAPIGPEPESETTYIEPWVGGYPRLPRQCHRFLRFSNITLAANPAYVQHIRAVTTIAREYFGDRIYEFSETSGSDRYIRRNGCYNYTEIQAALNRPGQASSQGTGPAALPLRGHEESVNGIISLDVSVDSQSYEIKQIPGKGQGMIATSDIPKGARIVLDAPVFWLPNSMETTGAAERAVIHKVKSLSREQQREFFTLHNAHKGECSPLLGIARTNMLPLAGDNGGLFLKASRINHACRPNAQNAWNDDGGFLTIHALRDIDAGSEITISYTSGVPMAYTERRRHLREAFSFVCACELCSLPKHARIRSEDQLRRIISLENQLHSDELNPQQIGDCAVPMLRLARRLVELLKEEEINDMSFSRVCFTTFQIFAIVGDKARAKVFAERAYAARKVNSGEDHPMTVNLKRLAERPVEHPLYGENVKFRGIDDTLGLISLGTSLRNGSGTWSAIWTNHRCAQLESVQLIQIDDYDNHRRSHKANTAGPDHDRLARRLQQVDPRHRRPLLYGPSLPSRHLSRTIPTVEPGCQFRLFDQLLARGSLLRWYRWRLCPDDD